MTRAIAFHKMHGAGNDFVVFEGEAIARDELHDQVVVLCDRRRGVGADGVIRVERTGEDRIAVDYWNADGSDAFCGNGTRCAVVYAHERGWIEDDATALTVGGPCRVRLRGGRAAVEMPGADAPRAIALPGICWDGAVHVMRVGVPHVVLVASDVRSVDLAVLGPRVRRHDALAPDGANVNVVCDAGPAGLELRTYERGVEAETLSCGSGATAAAICLRGGNGGSFSVTVAVASGDRLVVTRDGDATWLDGPTATSFAGWWELP